LLIGERAFAVGEYTGTGLCERGRRPERQIRRHRRV